MKPSRSPYKVVDISDRKITLSPVPKGQDAKGLLYSEYPAELQTSPAMRNGFYYVLPRKLLDEVVQQIPQLSSDPDTLENNRKLADWCDTQTHCVGFFRGALIRYPFLRERPKSTMDCAAILRDFRDMPDWQGITPEHLQFAVGEADERLLWIDRVARGYCGWLLANTTFIHEHHELIRRWKKEMLTNGFPQPGPHNVVTQPQTRQAYHLRQAKGRLIEFGRAVNAFCRRWQLRSLAGPYLPEPLQPQYPLLSLELVTELMRSGGSFIYIPYIYAIPSENELRSLVEDTMRRQKPPEHLASWINIVSGDYPNKGRTMDRYARLFCFQHYRRALHDHFGNRLLRKNRALNAAFARFFEVSTDAIKADAALLRNLKEE